MTESNIENNANVPSPTRCGTPNCSHRHRKTCVPQWEHNIAGWEDGWIGFATLVGFGQDF
jgi:hypothetical protein